MAIYRLGPDEPRVAATAWVADNATVIGRVELGENASVWYGSVLRADNDWIRIGSGSNVQEGCLLHTDPGFELVVGDGATVGHQCMLHGCRIGDGTLIGIQAVILNGAVIGRNSLVGAGALVTEGKVFPDGAMILGSPARLARMLTPEEMARYAGAAPQYVRQAARHRAQLERVA